MPAPVHQGGSFAPPLSDAKIADYKTKIAALPVSPVKDACAALLACCEKWWELPEPTMTSTKPHPSGAGTMVAMQADHQQVLFDLIPWTHELDAMAAVFDGISNETDKPLRDLAHHLLWHVKEMDLDREPITSDKL